MATAIKERPILFRGPMVKAILDGRKTITRRVVKPQPPSNMHRHCWFNASVYGWAYEPEPAAEWHRVKCPYGLPGDRLWVRESHWRNGYLCRWAGADPIEPHWITNQPLIGHESISRDQLVRFEVPDDLGHWKRTPSFYMPRWASRITLEITEVRVERLQEITVADAIAEGIFDGAYDPGLGKGGKPGWCYAPGCFAGSPRHAFELLWDSLNAERGFGWYTSPWVWVISFRRLPQSEARS